MGRPMLRPRIPKGHRGRSAYGTVASSAGNRGHLLTKDVYRNYRLEVEYRFPGTPGNCGVLVHASRARALYKMFPQSIEVQMNHSHAGDFWCIHENIEVPDMEARRPRKEGQKYGGFEGDARRILNLTDTSEKPLGEWNTMVVEARYRSSRCGVNGDLVNHGSRPRRRGRAAAAEHRGRVRRSTWDRSRPPRNASPIRVPSSPPAIVATSSSSIPCHRREHLAVRAYP